MAEFTEIEFAKAQERGEQELLKPRARHARYDAGRHKIIVQLTTGIEIMFSPDDAQGLRGASRAKLREIELDPFGIGLHFPAHDADFYVPSLVEGVLGSAKWMQALAERRAHAAAQPVPGKHTIRHPQRALADLRRLGTKPTPGSRAVIGPRSTVPDARPS